MTFTSQNAPMTQAPMTLPLSGLVEAATIALRKFIERRSVNESLEKLSDKNLRDIGLTLDDVSTIAHMPLPSNGALELSKIRKSRSGNW